MRHLFILVIATLAFITNASAQYTTVSSFTAKTYAKASTNEDTSATLTVGSYPYVTLHCTSTGSDSTVMYQNIDAYMNGTWINNILRDTLTLGNPTGYTPEAAKGQVRYRDLRSPSTNLIGGAVQIRIRNKHAAGAGDSTSALTYTQKLILRKP